MLLCAVIFVLMMIMGTPVFAIIMLSNCAASWNCKGQHTPAVYGIRPTPMPVVQNVNMTVSELLENTFEGARLAVSPCFLTLG